MSISTTSPPFVLRFTGLDTTVWYFVSSIFLPLPPKAFTASLSFDFTKIATMPSALHEDEWHPSCNHGHGLPINQVRTP